MKMPFIASLTIVLSACTAQMEVGRSLTERGYVNTPGYQIGEVWQWSPADMRLLPVTKIEDAHTSSRNEESATLNVRFETDVSFNGGTNLNSQEQAALEADVTARTSTELTNAIISSVTNPTTRIVADWNANPEVWRNELGISGYGWPSDGSPIYLVFIDRQTYAEKLVVEVDNTSAVGATFDSSVTSSSGNIKFEIIDTASLSILAGSSDRTPVYYDATIVRVRPDSSGSPRFSSRGIDPAVREDIQSYLLGEP